MTPGLTPEGLDLLAQGRNEEAVAEYERALALDPSFVDADVDLGFNYCRLGHFDKSIEYFDKAIWRARTIRFSLVSMAARPGPISG